jgi:hypothetical protein
MECRQFSEMMLLGCMEGGVREYYNVNGSNGFLIWLHFHSEYLTNYTFTKLSGTVETEEKMIHYGIGDSIRNNIHWQ